MEKEFVTYELAAKLKEIGFNEPCIAYYEGRKLKNYNNPFLETQIFNKDFKERTEGYRVDTCAAPLWQQALGYLRNRGIIITVASIFEDETHQVTKYWWWIQGQKEETDDEEIYFKTYEDALENALIAGLKMIKDEE